MSKLDKIIEILENKSFEISKDLENPTILITNTIPIIVEYGTANFELRAKHNSKLQNRDAIQDIHKIFNDSYELTNEDYLESFFDIFRLEYRAPNV